ncbi:MAG: O-antigen ligase family protein [Pseudomonadota bacterium]
MSTLQDTFRWIAYLITGLAVLPLGAVDPMPLSFSILAICIFFLIAIATMKQEADRRQLLSYSFGALVITLLCIIAAAVMQANANAVFSLVGDSDLPELTTPSNTVMVIATELSRALPFLSVLLFFTGCIAIIQSRLSANRMIDFCANFGIVFAIFGLIQFLLFPDRLLIFEKKAYLDSLTSFLVNRNHAATFIGVGILMQMARITREWFWKRELLTIPMLIYILCLLASVVALGQTLSRAGVFSTVVAALFFLLGAGLISTMKRKNRPYGGRTIWQTFVIPVAILGIVAVILPLTFQPLVQRGFSSLATDGRLCTYETTVSAIARAWPSGYGIKQFEVLFPAFRNAECGIFGIWDFAHSVFLEALFSVGIFAIPIALGLFIPLIITFLRGIFSRRRYWFASLIGLSIILLLTLHSLLDFSLQIHGVAIYSAMCLAALASASLSSSSKTREQTMPPDESSREEDVDEPEPNVAQNT